jgi:hypothetical protein
MAGTLTTAQRATFERDGVVRLRGAFTADAAAAMRDVVWTELERRGIRRDDPGTWVDEAPAHQQPLKSDPAFAAVWSATTLGAVADLLGAERATAPPDSGAFFLLFPSARPWRVPWKAWHVDHAWLDPKAPLRALKVHAHFGAIAPRAGGMTILAGGHHVIDAIARTLPPFPPGTRGEVVRRAIMRAHPYLQALGTDVGEDEAAHRARLERFVDREEDVLGFPVRVVENTAEPGDVLLMHPLTLHTRPTNAGRSPRFLLNKDLYPPGGPRPDTSMSPSR